MNNLYSSFTCGLGAENELRRPKAEVTYFSCGNLDHVFFALSFLRL